MDIRGVIRVFLLSTVVLGWAATSQTAQATALYDQCPATGSNSGCAILIQWDGGNFTTNRDPNQGSIFGDGDSLVGVQNNSLDKSLSYITLSGANLFGFDCSGLVSCSQLLTGYEGPNSYFVSSDSSNGTVYFSGGGIAPTSSTYFALEGDPQTICPSDTECSIVQGGGTLLLSDQGTLVGGDTIPEPGTVLLMGTGLAGLGFARSRKAS